MHIREVLAVCMGAALVVAACGCGGSGTQSAPPGGGGEVIQQLGFTVRAIDLTGLETTDLTPGPSSSFDYVAFAGTEITLFAWRSSVPPPAESAAIVFDSYRDGNFEVYVMNADGSDPVNLTNSPASDDSPSWSPDGSKIAFVSNRDGNWEIYAMNADGSSPVRLTNDPAPDGSPAWSPDGSKIAFDCYRDGNMEICVMDADGSNAVNLTNDPSADHDPCWSPDGSKIAFVSDRDIYWDIWVMNPDGTNQVNLTDSVTWDGGPAWSPDGGKIAFMSDRGGGHDIYVMNADGSEPTGLTSGGDLHFSPSWSPDGTSIAFEWYGGGDWEIYVMNADGSNERNVTMCPGPAGLGDRSPNWTLRGFFRCVIGPGGRDSGYNPPLGSQREAVIAVFDENSLRSVVGINSTPGATVTVKRLEPNPSLPIADVYADGILRVTEDAGRREPAIRHIAVGNAETEGWIYRVLIAFSRETGRVASMIAFRGELGPMAAGAPGPQCQVRDTGSEVVIRGSGMYLAIGDGQLADTPVNEVRLDGQTGEVVSAE